MPQTGYGSALSYFVPVGVIAAGLRLFWLNLFDLLGYHPFGIAWDWPLDRLIDFLLAPLVLVGALFVFAVVLHGSLKLLGGTHAPFVTTARVIAFSSAPQLFEFFPLVGSLAALLGTVALVVIGLREAQRTTTGRALAAFALPIATIIVLAFVLLLIVILGDIAAVLGTLSI